MRVVPAMTGLVVAVIAMLLARRSISRKGASIVDGLPVSGRISGALVYMGLFYFLAESVRYLTTIFAGMAFAGVVFNLCLTYGLLVTVGIMLIAYEIEEENHPFARFAKKSFAKSFWLGNLLSAILVSLGAYGLHQVSAKVTEPWLWLAMIVSMIVCLLWHAADSRNYGQEPIGEPRSSDVTPTKLYHDLAVYGVMVYASLTTWVPFVWFTITGHGDWTVVAAMVISCLVVAIVLGRIMPAAHFKPAAAYPIFPYTGEAPKAEAAKMEEGDPIPN